MKVKAFARFVTAHVIQTLRFVRTVKPLKTNLRKYSYDELMGINSPIDDVEKEINTAIEKLGQRSTVRHLATVICAQTNELTRLNAIVKECSDAMKFIKKAHTKAHLFLSQHKEFEDSDEEDTGEVKQ